MGYKALYRKWRPILFDDVIGQAHITNTLKNEILDNKIAHAYLFTGTRGTGKTSTAKIFSRAVNCEHPENGNPCNKCEVCKSILNDTVLDIIEIDAASNTGVDNIRTVIEQVQYAPTVGKYKVYIIDEVHMLSGGAFNALLKTLEEPPSHVIFILATTETHKIPATILSRCQRFDFKTITIDDIAMRISYILKEEKIDVEDEAIRYVSYLGRGSMRDSLSILEQCLSFSKGTLTYDDTIDILGSIDDNLFYEIARFVSDEDIAKLVMYFEQIVKDGKNLDNFTPGLLDVFRQIMVSKVSNGSVKTAFNEERNNQIKEIADAFSNEKLLYCIDVLSDLLNAVKSSPFKQTLIEVALIKMASKPIDNDVSSLVMRIESLESKVDGMHVANFENKRKETVIEESKNIEKEKLAVQNEEVKSTPQVEKQSEKTLEKQNNDIKIQWKKVVEKVFNEGGLQLYSAIFSSTATKNGETLIIYCKDEAKKQLLISMKNDVLNYVKSVFGDDIKIKIDSDVQVPATDNNSLFNSLDNLSNKYPENFDMK
ncbi:MAG: DNA polymerase III subunit gamma/tau [Ruminococcaceae bacterium]|nr:DNA polymerase III subunit gamma/tau [Oscillospiraceae bacterium]